MPTTIVDAMMCITMGGVVSNAIAYANRLEFRWASASTCLVYQRFWTHLLNSWSQEESRLKLEDMKLTMKYRVLPESANTCWLHFDACAMARVQRSMLQALCLL